MTAPTPGACPRCEEAARRLAEVEAERDRLRGLLGRLVSAHDTGEISDLRNEPTESGRTILAEASAALAGTAGPHQATPSHPGLTTLGDKSMGRGCPVCGSISRNSDGSISHFSTCPALPGRGGAPLRIAVSPLPVLLGVPLDPDQTRLKRCGVEGCLVTDDAPLHGIFYGGMVVAVCEEHYRRLWAQERSPGHGDGRQSP